MEFTEYPATIERRAVILHLDRAGSSRTAKSFEKLYEKIAENGFVSVQRAEIKGGDAQDVLTRCEEALGQFRRSLAGSGSRLYVMAYSDLAAVALDLLRRHPGRESGVILISPTLDAGPTGGHMPWSGAENPLTSSPTGMPFRLLLLQGRADQIADPDLARRFVTSWAPGTARLIEVPQATHQSILSSKTIETHAGPILDMVLKTFPPEVSQLPEGTSILYGIGAQKAGTSWLYDFLKGHPECHVPEQKELHYFDVLYGKNEEVHRDRQLDSIREAAARIAPPFEMQDDMDLLKIQTWARHLRIYADKPRVFRRYVEYLTEGRNKEPLLTDITPSYMTLDAETFRTMDRIGTARFLFLLRDPVDRLWSQIRMKIANEGDALTSDAFEMACAARAMQICANGNVHRIPRADYDRTIRELEWAIPAERIKYVFHEPTFSQATADEICDFAGISRQAIQPPRDDLRGRDASLPADIEAMLHEALAPQYRAMTARFGTLPDSWRGLPAPRPSRPINSTPLPSGNAAPTLAFLHIPKTAGMSVISEIRRIVGDKNSSPITLHTQAKGGPQMPAGYRFYSGHLDWDEVDNLPENRFVFTILRDPKERIASFYFYSLREAEKCSAEDLQRPDRTNMRLISTLSADDYFFGGTADWQRFIRDQYDNFYCSYLATRKMRASGRMEGLSTDEQVQLALRNCDKIDRIYMLDDLGPLEQDLEEILQEPVRLRKTFKNAGPKAGKASRWTELAARFERDDSLGRLERFTQHDSALIRAMGFGGKDD